MRYIANDQNYVTAVTFGAGIVYNDCACTEYTGTIPSGWNSLDDWYFDEGDKLWRWKIVNGNLKMDPTAEAPRDKSLGTPLLQTKSVYPSTNWSYIYPDDGYDGLERVICVPMDLQSKEVALTGASQTITADDGYDGMAEVIIGGVKSASGTVYVSNSDYIELPDTGITNFTAVCITRTSYGFPDKSSISTVYEVCASIISGASVAISGFFMARRDGSTVEEGGVNSYGGSLSAYSVGAVRINGTGVANYPFKFDGNYTYTVFGY